MVNADVLGVVLNFLPVKGPDAYAYSYYSYDAAPPPRTKRGNRNARDGKKQRSSAPDAVQPPHDHATH
jgi:hypothetical protein